MFGIFKEKLFKNIIFNTQFDQTENCDYVAQILNYLNSSPVLVLPDFKELLDKIGKEQKPAMVAQPKPVETAPAQPAVHVAAPQQPVAPNYPPVNTAAPQQPVSRARHENLQFGANYTSTGRLQNPPKPAKAEPPKPAPAPAAAPEEPGMSMFYLLQHYNKENAAIYKAQQEAKKNKKNAAAAAAPQPVKQKPGAKQPNVVFADPGKPAPAPGGFAVPGKQPPAAPGGFAVPGKQPPAAPGGFAVPGKQPPAPGGFAVPGKQPPAAPGGFAVPGRQTVPGGFTVPSKPAAAPGQMQGGMPPVQKPAQPANAAPQNAAPRQAAAPAYQRPAPAYQQPAPTYQQPAPAYQQPQGNAINFGETTVLSAGIGETTVLGGATEVNHTEPHLIRTKNNEKIPLNKPVFRIGKERSYVDYFISDNTAISRSHANIINHNGEFFVVDTNSTNHTYVNGGMISSNVETRLSHGTKIRLANEDFEFRMY